MEIVDFRIRPPYKGLATVDVMYTNPERTRRLTRNTGLAEPTKVLDTLSVEDTVQEMDEAGIAIGVVPGRRFSTQLQGNGEIPNSDISDLVAEYPGRFVGLAAIDLRTPLSAIRDAEKIVGDPAFAGFMLEPGLVGEERTVDDRALYPIYELLEAEGKIAGLMFGALSGLTVEHPHPATIDRVARDFPNLNLVLSHGGWPWVIEVIGVAHRRRNIYLEPDMYLFGMAGWREWVDAGNSYLSDRFLFSSSFPYVPLVAAVKKYEEIFNDAVLEDILVNNARRILGLDEAGEDLRWIADTAHG